MTSDTNSKGAPDPSATQNGRRRSRLLLVAAVSVMLGVAAYNAFLGRSLGAQEVHIFGQDQWTAGAPASVRVVLLRHSNQQPMANASVRIMLTRPKAEYVELAAGHTNAAGTLDASFKVPDGEGMGRLLVVADSSLGRDFIQRPVRLVRTERIFLSADRPAYRAGQRVRLHAWVRSVGISRPAARRELSLTAFAPGAIAIARRTGRTDDSGSATFEVDLAPGVPAGRYSFKVATAHSSLQITLPVMAGPEPAFPVWLSDVTLYAKPGGRVRGTLHATDRLGGALRGAPARVWLERSGRTLAAATGKLDAHGRMAFRLPAPAARKPGPIALRARVADDALRTALAMQAVYITAHPIALAAVPESGVLVPNIENRVYLLARYPDGTPASVPIRCTVDGQTHTLNAGPYGVATLTLVPGGTAPRLALTAEDEHGRTGSYEAALPQAHWSEAEWMLRERYRLLTARPKQSPPGPMLLRPNRGLYAPGSRMRIEVLSPGGNGHVYVDGFSDGQTVFTRAATLRNGHSVLEMAIPEGITGTLWLRAYRLGTWGDLARAYRAVFVQPAATNPMVLQAPPLPSPAGGATRVAIRPGESGPTELLLYRAPEGAGNAEPPVAVPGVLATPALLGAGTAAAGATQEQRQEAVLAALATMPPPGSWGLLVDQYAEKQALLLQRRAASWMSLRWAVLVVLTLLWLLAVHLLTRTPPSGHAGKAEPETAASEDGETALAPGTALQDAASPGEEPEAAEADAPAGAPPRLPRTLAPAALRFVVVAGLIALATNVLYSWMDRPADQERVDQAKSLRLALAQERAAQAAVPARLARLLQPAVRPSTPLPQVAFRAAGLSADGSGGISVALPLPEDAGLWRLAATAITPAGLVARATTTMDVVVDTPVEFDPPPVMRAGDEVGVSIRARNATSAARTLRAKLMAGPGLVVLGDAVRAGQVAAGAGITWRFRVGVDDRPGPAVLSILMGDGRLVRREIEIAPAAPERALLVAGRLGRPVSHALSLPHPPREATVTLHPSAASLAAARFSELVHTAGSGALHHLAVLEVARMALPARHTARARVFAEMERGFQELLACRGPEGGFGLYPGAPADVAATAYAVGVLRSCREVLPGADRVARIARSWLGKHQRADGSWHPETAEWRLTTAYAAMCLGAEDDLARRAVASLTRADSGDRSRNEDALDANLANKPPAGDGQHPDANGMLPARAPQRTGGERKPAAAETRHADTAGEPPAGDMQRPGSEGKTPNDDAQPTDPYRLALLTLAMGSEPKRSLAAAGAGGSAWDRLAADALSGADTCHWVSRERTLDGLSGPASAAETTALAVLALSSFPQHHLAVKEGAAFLAQARQRDGSWGSPRVTALALRALAAALPAGTNPATAVVAINGKPVARLSEDRPSLDLRPHLPAGSSLVTLTPEGAGSLVYELAVTAEGLAPRPAEEAPALSSTYAPLSVPAGEPVTFTARLSRGAGPLLLDVPLPAGFRPVRSDLEDLVRYGPVVAFQVSPRRVLLTTHAAGRRGTVRLTFRMVATDPGQVLAPAPVLSSVTNPAARAEGRPARLVVR